MPWVKLDDQIMRNPKVRAVSRDAFAMHIAGFCYCATALTDGHIPDRDLPLVAAEALAPEASACELGEVGLWERREGGWEIHDYLDYQPSRSDVLEDRRKARDRKRAQRDRQRHDGSHGGTDAGSHDGSPTPPVPSRPVLEEPPSISGLTQYGLDPDAVVDHIARVQLKDRQTSGGEAVRTPDAWLRRARSKAAVDYGAKALELAATFAVSSEAELGDLVLERKSTRYLGRRGVA